MRDGRFSKQSSNTRAEHSVCQLQCLRDEAKTPCVSQIVEICNKDLGSFNYIGLFGQELLVYLIIFM